MWHDLIVSGVPLTEKILRTVAVYLALGVLLRLIGKRDMAQLNTMDLVVMLLLANVVQNAIIGPDYSLAGGVVGAVVLLAVDAAVVRMAARWTWAWRTMSGRPTVLARDGRYDRAAMWRLAIRRSDVDVVIQRQGGDGVADTELVTLEPDGATLVQLRTDKRPATGADIAALHARLARIEARLADAPGTTR